MLGLGAGDKPVIVSLREDSPHIACSAGSGAGKSVLAQTVAVQVLARGGQVVILDLKGSHRWALGLPGIVYCTPPDPLSETITLREAVARGIAPWAFDAIKKRLQETAPACPQSGPHQPARTSRQGRHRRPLPRR